MTEKPSKTPANLPKTPTNPRQTPAKAHETPTIPRATITVSRATTTILNVTPDVSIATPTVLAATPAIAARNAWYTVPMPWLRNAHRHTKTRWMLTVLSFALLCGWFVGAWGSVTYTWPSGAEVGVVHGDAVLRFPTSVNPDGPLVVGSMVYWTKPWWRLNLYWGTPALDATHSACSLCVPGVLFGAVAAWLWYRRFRPFARPGRPNRALQFKVLRSLSTSVLVVVLALAIASRWTGVLYRGTLINASLFDAILSVSCKPPPPRVKATGFAMITQLQREQYAQARSTLTGVDLSAINARHWQFWHVSVSLWFLSLLLAVPAALLWLIRLRHYPSGRCPTCQYDLTGLAADVPCPECGYTPNAPRSAAP